VRRARYDYLLVVGPGRSGSEFLYRTLEAHESFMFPEIKEGIYYRSSRTFRRARRRLRGKPGLLCDISNEAYNDPALIPGITTLKQEGVRILMMVLLRNHRERAFSMMQFRRSRGEPAALFGARYLEQTTIRDQLTPEALKAIYSIEVDTLTISFKALTRDTAAVLQVLADLCQTSGFDFIPGAAVNESVNPRFMWLSTFGWCCGYLLRRLGFRRMLQGIKNPDFVHRIFFVSGPVDRSRLHLSEESLNTLETSFLECGAIVERSSEKLGEGIYFRKADRHRQAPVTTQTPDGYEATQRRTFGRLVRAGVYGTGFEHSAKAKNFVRNCLRTWVPVAGDRGLRILDCGCGTGVWLDFIRGELERGGDSSHQYYGFDLTPEMIEVAHERLRTIPPAHLRIGDIMAAGSYAFDGEASLFDLIFCYDVVQQLPPQLQLQACEMMTAHLTTNGTVLILDQDCHSLFGRAMGYANLLKHRFGLPLLPTHYTATHYPPLGKLAHRFAGRGWRTGIVSSPNGRKRALTIQRSSAAEGDFEQV